MFRNTFEKPKRPNWRTGCPVTRAPGALKGSTLFSSGFPTSILSQNIKKIEEGHFENFLKSYAEKYAENKTTFIFQFIVTNDSIWHSKVW